MTENQTESATDGRAQRPRLVVELTPRAAADLDEALAHEGTNKTTVVNRALQIYRLVMDAQDSGGGLFVRSADGSTVEQLRIV